MIVISRGNSIPQYIELPCLVGSVFSFLFFSFLFFSFFLSFFLFLGFVLFYFSRQGFSVSLEPVLELALIDQADLKLTEICLLLPPD